MRRPIVFALLLWLFAFPSFAGKTELVLSESPGAVSCRFSVPGESFMLLLYATPRESGQCVLYGENGEFSATVPLPCTESGSVIRLTVKDLRLTELAQGKITLTKGTAVSPTGSSTIRKAERFALTETPAGFAYDFYAPGTDHMELYYRNKQQTASFFIFPLDDTGHYAGEVTQSLTYARTLTTVTVRNGRGQEAASGTVRKGYEAPPAPEKAEGRLDGVTVCIDPGHQEDGIPGAVLTAEPLGPGLEGRASGTPGSAQGTITLRRESIVMLEISMRLRDELLAQGANVIMTREKQDVFHTNIERAQIAADGGADILLRLHADMADSPDKRGVSVYSPLHSDYARQAAAPAEYRAMGEALLNAVKRAVGYEIADKTGRVYLNDDYVGNNWAAMPCFLVEMGYMSNAREDLLLSQPVYQQALAEGMAQGVYEIAVMRGWVEAE